MDESIKWEAHLDKEYFMTWCVRPEGRFELGKTFYVQTQAAAETLRDMLNRGEQ